MRDLEFKKVALVQYIISVHWSFPPPFNPINPHYSIDSYYLTKFLELRLSQSSELCGKIITHHSVHINFKNSRSKSI